MKISRHGLLPLMLSSFGLFGCSDDAPPRPNLVFILMDDAGYGDFGCYGQQKIETPNIDSLSARGIRFTQMYTSAPLSSPARCGLLTGRHSGHADIRANDEMEWRGDVWNHEAMLRDSTLEGQAPMQAGTPTLGTVLRDAGYSTGMIGKWGVGGPASESTPGKMGFDTYFGCICQRQAHTYYPPFLWENDRRFYLSNRLVAPGTPLDEGADPLKAFVDTFPAGTLSGAPKVRAMQLISQYEPHCRGAYGGCIGYIGLNGNLNQAITIRTFVARNGELWFQAGGGIVARSSVEGELQEVNNKLGALRKAISMAEQM